MSAPNFEQTSDTKAESERKAATSGDAALKKGGLMGRGPWKEIGGEGFVDLNGCPDSLVGSDGAEPEFAGRECMS